MTPTKSSKLLRDSNFELLRIILMLSIILFHYSDHGCTDISYENSLAYNNAFECFCRVGGGLGNCCFMIMTGFFSSTSQFKVKKVVRIWSQVFFYSFVSYVLACTLEITYLKREDLIDSLLPITSNQYWYFTAYIIVIFASPLMNYGIERMEKKQLQLLLLSMLWFFSIMPTCEYYYTTSDDRIGVMMLLYLAGGYIRKYHKERNSKALKYEVFLMMILLLCFSMFSIFYEMNDVLQEMAIDRFYFIGSVEKTPIIVLSIIFFLIFKNLNVRSNEVINWMASSTFGVYLLHMNKWTTPIIWEKMCRAKDYYMSKSMIFHVVVCTILIYVICTAIDKLRCYLIETPVFNAVINIKERGPQITIVFASITVIAFFYYVYTLRLVSPFDTSLLVKDCTSIAVLDQGATISESFRNEDTIEVRQIVFPTITWNQVFLDEQLLMVSIVDSSQKVVYCQNIPMKLFGDQIDYYLRPNEELILNANETYRIEITSNNVANQQYIALLITDKSDNLDGQCLNNNMLCEGHLAVNIKGFRK